MYRGFVALSFLMKICITCMSSKTVGALFWLNLACVGGVTKSVNGLVASLFYAFLNSIVLNV